MRKPRLLVGYIAVGMIGTLILAVLSVRYGSTVIAYEDVMAALFGDLWPDNTDRVISQRIVLDLRLPRAILAMVVGAGLGVVGALLQTVTRNELADPFLFGLSSGAAAGAVAVITVFGDRLGLWTLPVAAFCGGMLAASIVLTLVQRMRRDGPERIILAGLAVSFLFAALTNYLVFAGDQRAAHSVLFWSLGGLGLARWQNLPWAIFGFIAIFCFALSQHRNLDGLLGGENVAKSLGINPRRLRRMTFAVAAFATAVFVSLTGIIGFIGLMVPHVARHLNGPLHFGVIWLSAILGAVLLLGSDLAARLVLAPQEIPVGIVTTSIGGLFVLVMLMRR